MDKKKTWTQVDQIIKVLNIGCKYLDFPVNLDHDVLSSNEEQKALDRAEYGEDPKKGDRLTTERESSPPIFDGDLEDIAEDENGEGSFTSSGSSPHVSANKSNSGIDMGGSRLGPNSGLGELDLGLDSP